MPGPTARERPLLREVAGDLAQPLGRDAGALRGRRSTSTVRRAWPPRADGPAGHVGDEPRDGERDEVLGAGRPASHSSALSPVSDWCGPTEISLPRRPME
jgi:hypothetical protein